MATESFEKDFVITEEQAPLWEAALNKLEHKEITHIPKKENYMSHDELLNFLKRAKSSLPFRTTGEEFQPRCQ